MRQTKADLIKEVDQLKAIIENQEKELSRLRAKEAEANAIISGKYFEPTQNERGAGRKPKITREIKEEVDACKNQGMTYREIAEKMGLSLGYVHKVYSDKTYVGAIGDVDKSGE